MSKEIEQLWNLQVLEMGPDGGRPESEPLIKKLRQQIPAPILAHYDRLRARGKTGVAVVRNTVCTGCHMRLAVGIHAELQRGEDILLCDTCGRYLVLAPEDKPGAAPPPPPAPAKAKKAKSLRTSLRGRKPSVPIPAPPTGAPA